MKSFAFLMILAATCFSEPRLDAADSAPVLSAPQQTPLPPAGQQLSTVEGVSIIRVEAKDEERAIAKIRIFDFFGRARFKATDTDLETVLKRIATIDTDHVILRTPLPDGIYNVEVTAPEGGGKKMFELFQESLASSFGIQVRFDHHDVTITAMRRTSRWNDSPLPPAKGLIFNKPLFKIPGFSKPQVAAKSPGRLWFEGDMDFLANVAESYIGKSVVNRTGVETKCAFDMPLRESFEAADFEAFLESHGIEFVDEPLGEVALYVEPIR